jgi:phosphoglycolate phosphatase-like HAD superfamily hydrolase
VEWRCYALAIERVTGRSLADIDWTTFAEPTSSAIVRALLADDADAASKEELIKHEFCNLLEEERPNFPGDFSPIPGAVEFMTRLERDGICSVAIATGCFDASARYKLACCGVALERYRHATASDTPTRREIIPLAAARAGFGLSSVVYFGDASWDVAVSRALGIPMIGIGRRIEQLRALHVRFTFRDYSDPDAILAALQILRSEISQESSTSTPA